MAARQGTTLAGVTSHTMPPPHGCRQASFLQPGAYKCGGSPDVDEDGADAPLLAKASSPLQSRFSLSLCSSFSFSCVA